ncbi:hypothetical protein [Aurantiacibacter hainanensis]|uniref:hypothetical protein n=1 Tax=Aurantiacibacter hainanensis TaxID=3076114 RepID=UPI0030C6FEB7
MRNIVIIAVAALLAILAGSQALSNALASREPALAARLSPLAAEASEREAASLVSADTGALTIDVSAARGAASRALDRSLLSTEALAILALASPDPDRQAEIMEGALALSRRGRVLNSAAMMTYAETRQVDELLETLNRTLLIYPSQKEAMIPLLIEQLSNDGLVPAFVDLLATEPQWAEDFLVEAAVQDELADNLAAIRLALPRDTQVGYEADRSILRALARVRSYDTAAQLYARILGEESLPPVSGSLGWGNVYSPFHWDVYDRAGRFARVDSDGNALGLTVRSGNGGLLARRLIRLPETTTVFQVSHTLDVRSASHVRLTLQCAQGEGRWSDTLGPSPTMMRVDQELDCEYVWLGITARAPAGTVPLSGQITDITVM